MVASTSMMVKATISSTRRHPVLSCAAPYLLYWTFTVSCGLPPATGCPCELRTETCGMVTTVGAAAHRLELQSDQRSRAVHARRARPAVQLHGGRAVIVHDVLGEDRLLAVVAEQARRAPRRSAAAPWDRIGSRAARRRRQCRRPVVTDTTTWPPTRVCTCAGANCTWAAPAGGGAVAGGAGVGGAERQAGAAGRGGAVAGGTGAALPELMAGMAAGAVWPATTRGRLRSRQHVARAAAHSSASRRSGCPRRCRADSPPKPEGCRTMCGISTIMTWSFSLSMLWPWNRFFSSGMLISPGMPVTCLVVGGLQSGRPAGSPRLRACARCGSPCAGR